MFLWNIAVTSLVEVWIEIRANLMQICFLSVTSLVEVWIEIDCKYDGSKKSDVTSLVEVWIEIGSVDIEFTFDACHFPCGSVD